MKNIPSPHIEAKENDFAKTVLMSGDPLRTKMIAQNFLDNAKQVNGVRGALGYTGNYKNHPVSLMTSGMGIPSMGIYSYELFNFYGIDNIIRIGTIGGLSDDVNLRDVIVAQGASTDSNFQDQFGLRGHFAPLADFGLLTRAVEVAKDLGKSVRVGNVLTSDVFYSDASVHIKWKEMGVLGVEMETAGLYINASRAKKRALAIYTVSDLPLKHLSLPSIDRQESFVEMVEIALETAIRLQ